MPVSSTPENDLPWYVCQTKPRQESLAVRKLEEQGYEVFLPKLTLWQKKKDHWCRTEKVMFPRYAFVSCASRKQSIAPIRSTPGVTGLVSFGNTPATLDQHVLDAIRAIADEQSRPPPEQSLPFKIGETVSVADGPLKGLSGIVSNVARERVVVLLTLLGREKPIAVPADHLLPA